MNLYECIKSNIKESDNTIEIVKSEIITEIEENVDPRDERKRYERLTSAIDNCHTPEALLRAYDREPELNQFYTIEKVKDKLNIEDSEDLKERDIFTPTEEDWDDINHWYNDDPREEWDKPQPRFKVGDRVIYDGLPGATVTKIEFDPKYGYDYQIEFDVEQRTHNRVLWVGDPDNLVKED